MRARTAAAMPGVMALPTANIANPASIAVSAPSPGSELFRAPPSGEDLRAPVDREEQSTGDLGDRVKTELERRHHAEWPAAPAQCPEERRLVLCIGANQVALCIHELDGQDAVRREAVAACEPADPANEGVADDADVGCGACERRKVVLSAVLLTSAQSTPASTRARRFTGLISTLRIRSVLTSTGCASEPIAAAPCPVPWGATRRPRSRFDASRPSFQRGSWGGTRHSVFMFLGLLRPFRCRHLTVAVAARLE
jgi:hypothetical protein